MLKSIGFGLAAIYIAQNVDAIGNVVYGQNS